MQESDDLHLDPSDFAFLELTGLVNEFYIVPRFEFPFRCLDYKEIWEEHGLLPKERFFDSIRGYAFKGNYVAASILRQLRVDSGNYSRMPKNALQKMQDMPSDIILEISGHLHPIDLYSLIRTSKSIRNLLLSKRSLSVWKLAFARHEDIPDIPEGISPPRWVTTIFAPPRCDSCGIYPAMVHYIYNDRRCLGCASEEYCSGAQAVSMMGFTMTSEEINKYVRHTCTQSPHTPPFFTSSYVGFSRPPVYRKLDIETFLDQMRICRKSVEESCPGAQAHFNEFLLNSAQAIENHGLAAEKNERWSRDVYHYEYYEYVSRSLRITSSWMRRLRNLGFHPKYVGASRSTLDAIIRSNYVTKPDKKTFLKFRKEAKKAIAFGMSVVVHQGMRERKEKVKAFYHAEIVHKYPLSLCNNLPSEARVLGVPYVRRFIEWGVPETPIWTDTSEVVQAIHTFVQCWLANSESLLLHTLHCAGYDINESDVRSTISIAAMGVFVCPDHDNMSLVGWEGVVSHLECSLDYSGTWSHGSPILKFSAAGHEVVSILAKSVGKDVCSATIADFDADRDIYICADCPMMPFGNDYGTHFFTWRQAVEHGVIWSPAHRHFVPLSDETRRYIWARQKPLMDPMQSVWACNHCSRHVHDFAPVGRANVIKHLAKIHGIKGPKFENDWIYMGSWRPSVPTFIARQPPECFICKLCPPGRIFKLYREQALRMHHSAKHHLDNPIENLHWKMLDIPTDPHSLTQ